MLAVRNPFVESRLIFSPSPFQILQRLDTLSRSNKIFGAFDLLGWLAIKHELSRKNLIHFWGGRDCAFANFIAVLTV